jgi:hypothetical protein
MRITILAFICFFKTIVVFAQPPKPSIMLLPDKNWMVLNNFSRTVDNEGVAETIIDYETAFLKNPDLNAILDKIAGEFLKSGFKTENLLRTLDDLKADAAEEAVRKTKNSSGKIRVNDIDVIRRKVKTDIEVYFYWNIETVGPRKRVTDFRISAVDTYTNQNIAFAPGGSSEWVSASQISNPELLRETVLSQMDAFKNSLRQTFDDMFANGREMKLSILTWDNAPFDLESDSFGDQELSVLIKNWVRKNAYLGRFSAPTSSETRMEFKSIRIPLQNEEGRIDGEDWARGLVAYLKKINVKPIKVDPKGLGHVILILGGQ